MIAWPPATRFAWRRVRATPATSVLLVAILAVGITAELAIALVKHAVVTAPLPYVAPPQLYLLWMQPAGRESVMAGYRDPLALRRQVITPQQLLDIREHSVTLNDVAAIELLTSRSHQVDVVIGGHTERLRGALATPNVFDLLGVTSARGRLFRPDDDGSTTVISHRLWARLAAQGDPLGATVSVRAGPEGAFRDATVVGVLPDEVRFTYPEAIDVWLTLPWADVRAATPVSLRYVALARTTDGATPGAVVADVKAVSPLPTNRPRLDEWRVEDIASFSLGTAEPVVRMFALQAHIVSVIAALSLLVLLLTRVIRRRREDATVRALGADRIAIGGAVILEAALIGVAGAAAAVAVTFMTLPLMRTALSWMPRGDMVTVAWPVTLLVVAVSIAACLTIALPAAWLAARPSGGAHQQRFGASRSEVRSIRAALAGQVAVVTGLAMLALGLGLSLQALRAVPVGFQADDVWVAAIDTATLPYRDGAVRGALVDRLVQAVSSVPGVIAAGVASATPIVQEDMILQVPVADDTRVMVARRHIDRGYLDVLRPRLIAGRLFTADDERGARPVALVTEDLARLMCASPERCLEMPVLDGLQIVGVVADMRSRRLDEAPRPVVLVPIWRQLPFAFTLVARTQPGQPLEGPIAAAMQSLDPLLPRPRVLRLDEEVRRSIADRELFAATAVLVGFISVLVAGVALASVLRQELDRRAPELGIRAALGAAPVRLVVLLIRESALVVAGGVAAGWGLGWAALRLAAASLFGITPSSAIVFALVTTLLVAVAVAAAVGPALRARRLDVAAALRQLSL